MNELHKFSGAGNTFIFIDDTQGQGKAILKRFHFSNRKAFAKHICKKKKTDGLVFVQSGKTAAFQWDFYNSDGSHAEMCGNAARCAVQFVLEKHLYKNKAKINFFTKGGGFEFVQKKRDQITVRLPFPRMEKTIFLEFMGEKKKRRLINSGVPHLVLEGVAPNRMKKHVSDVARLRKMRSLGPRGANVTGYVVTSKGRIHTITFERGVESFTRACGTGAIAAALDFFSRHSRQGPTPIQVKMPGGTLRVLFFPKRKMCFLTGPVQKISNS